MSVWETFIDWCEHIFSVSITPWEKCMNKWQELLLIKTSEAVEIVTITKSALSVLKGWGCNPTYQLSNKENGFCCKRKAFPILHLLCKYTDNHFKGTHNTARGKKGWQKVTRGLQRRHTPRNFIVSKLKCLLPMCAHNYWILSRLNICGIQCISCYPCVHITIAY